MAGRASTALGEFDAPGVADGEFTAVFRPETVRAGGDASVRGVVETSFYRGGHYLHGVRLPDETRVLYRAEATMAPGTEIALEAEMPVLVPVPRGGAS
jgi:hypothetical protein